MKITPTSLTISQLLSNESEMFVVPAYQRRYSWHPKHIAEMFDDINQLEKGETHLLGSLVCLTTSHGVGINSLELVDGQQRMTTIMLFLNAIEEKYKVEGKEKDAEKIGNYLYCSNFDGTQANKLKLGDLDSLDFDKVMENKNVEGIINKRLLDGYNLIYSLIDKLTDNELDTFKYKFINQANVIRLDVAESKDAFKLFETINNRGLRLSPADIIKNFLLGTASLIDDKTLEEVKKDWTSIIVDVPDLYLNDFFRQYMNGLLGRKVTFTMLIDTFKSYFKDNVSTGEILSDLAEFSPVVVEEDTEKYDDNEASEQEADKVVKPARNKKPKNKISITKFVDSLSKSAETYSKIINLTFDDPRVNRHIRNLQKIRSFASYTFILNLMQRKIDINDKLAILKIVETFMLRRNIAEYRTAELDDIFSNLTTLADDNIVENATAMLRGHLPSDLEFKEKIIEHEFKGVLENRAKYILEQLEYYLTGDTKEKYIGDSYDVHLEHIIPQTITTKKSKEEFGDWERYLGVGASLHKNLVSKIGNLTLLSAPLNIKASNNPFLNKKIEYEKSIIKITKQLKNFEEFKAEQVNQRSRDIAQKAVKIWKF